MTENFERVLRTSLAAAKQKLREQHDAYIQTLLDNAPTILLAGFTGTGKSSIIRTVFPTLDPEGAMGMRLPAVRAGGPCTTNFEEFGPTDRCTIRLVDSRGLEAESQQSQLQALQQFVRVRDAANDPVHQVHLVWYCAHNRWQTVDTEAVKTVLKRYYDEGLVVVLMTKCDILSDTQMDEMEAEINAAVPNCPVLKLGVPQGQVARLPTACPDNHVVLVDGEEMGTITASATTQRWTCDFEGCTHAGPFTCKPFGFVELVQNGQALLPQSCEASFLAAQNCDFETKERQSIKIASQQTLAAGAIGLTPIPFSDAPLLIANQAGMFARIAITYGITVQQGEPVLAYLLAQCSVSGAGIIAASCLKLLPGVGTAIGGVMEGSVAASLTAGFGAGTIAIISSGLKQRINAVQLDWDSILKQEVPRLTKDILKCKESL